jgi:BirA family biotin operon repressor/biotin-[acetyl-CoA-carboxylase] ligase
MKAIISKMRTARVHLPTVGSTNTYAKENLANFDSDAITVITADEQTSGRGRLGRQWNSTGEDITATFCFMVPAVNLPTAYQLSPLMALVARRALHQHGVQAQVKWPNDLIVSGCKKVGGILCEMDSYNGHFWACLGLGLNVNSEAEALGVERPIWPLSTLKTEYPALTLPVPALIDALVREFAQALPTFLSSDFAPFQSEYESASLLLGKRIRFRVSAGQVVQGKAEAIANDGQLMVQQDGETEATGFLSGEVSGVELLEPSTGGRTFIEGVEDGLT